jgi:hypothetical protein
MRLPSYLTPAYFQTPDNGCKEVLICEHCGHRFRRIEFWEYHWLARDLIVAILPGLLPLVFMGVVVAEYQRQYLLGHPAPVGTHVLWNLKACVGLYGAYIARGFVEGDRMAIAVCAGAIWMLGGVCVVAIRRHVWKYRYGWNHFYAYLRSTSRKCPICRNDKGVDFSTPLGKELVEQFHPELSAA